ncbi:hypothetical protein LIER_36637 [Lithospermum erythrorhizon]|uniref:Uncharacterized protein n=1 Tax=Lithospermum erythrorhizon TaxID=34254 RepID=A0AAV3P8L9_LITER
MGPKTRLAANGKSYKKEYGHVDKYWEQLEQHTYTLRDLGREAPIASQSSPEYTEWFPKEQYRQPVQQGWSTYPKYEYGNLSINPDDENSE